MKLQLRPSTKSASTLRRHVTSAFSKYKYPQIRSVGICSLSYPLLSSCPGARSVSLRFDVSQTGYDAVFQDPLPLSPGVKSLALAVPYPACLEGIDHLPFLVFHPEFNAKRTVIFFSIGVAKVFPNVQNFIFKWGIRTRVSDPSSWVSE